MRRHFRSALQTTSIPFRCFSWSAAIATIINATILRPISSATSWIFQSHCSRSLCEIIETTDRIEVSGLNTLLHFIPIRILMSHTASYTENDCSVLRSKICRLHPVQRASLGALLRHLLRVASHSDRNAMTVEELAIEFRYAVLRGNEVVQDGVYVKARCNDLL